MFKVGGCLLTDDQKQQCIDVSERCLQLFQSNKKSFCVVIWQWMKHGSNTSLQSQISCQLSGKQPKTQTSAGKVLASVFCDVQCILFIDYLEKERTINSEYHIALLVCLKEEIAPKRPKWRRKSALSQRQCIMSQVDRNDCKTTWIALRITSAPTLFSRSGPQKLLAVCRPQKNSPGKEIWRQWRSDIGNWGVFRNQRRALLQKKALNG